MTVGPDSWLGAIPTHWQVRRLGTLGSFAKGAGGSKEDNQDEGAPVVRYGELYTRFGHVIEQAYTFVSEESAVHYTPLRHGTIVFAGSGEDPEEIGKAALSLLDEPAYVGGDTVLFSPNGSTTHAPYLAYVLESPPLKALKSIRSTGFTVVHISAGKLKTLPVPLPPLAEQRAIADYLDRETVQIDNLIAEQERLVSLLSERRQAATDRVLGVRVGFGERLRWSVTEVDARAGARAVTLPLLSVSISWGVRRREDAVGEGSRAAGLSNYKVCTQGDLVINRMRAFQGALGLAAEDGVVSPDYAVLNVAEDLDPQWLAAVMRTPSFVAEMAKRVKGIGSADLGSARTPRINVADLGEIRIAAPSRDQQAAEVSDLADELERLDLLMLEVERFIELSRERRSALITAAVTGQIDVREAA